MKNLGFSRKKLIAIAATVVTLAASFGAYSVNAAGHIDLTADVNISAAIGAGDASQFATSYEGEMVIDLYKIAELDESGNIKGLTPDFANSGAKLSVLSNKTSEDKDKKVEEVKTEIVEKVKPIAQSDAVKPTATITATKTKDGLTNATATIAGGAGIYLFVPHDCSDADFNYTFTSYILYAPTSDYITLGSGSDEWKYDARFLLKSEAKPKYGNVIITKNLKTFNDSLGTASFIFDVEATRDSMTVFSNVYTLTFDKNDNYVDGAFTKSITIDKVPAGTTITVTEVYSGASYQIDVEENKTQTIEDLKAGETGTVEFTNDYDEHLKEGGISVVNTFEKVETTENGPANVEYNYTGNNLEGGN